ncbi:glycosyl hydrolase 108 family protein [Hymenobacter coalescens]
MADFAHYFPTLLANEGGYCHDALDPGGETYRGVARTANPHWAGWPTIDAVKARLGLPHPVPAADWHALNQALAADAGLAAAVQAFYKAAYWNPLRLDAVHSQSVADQLADHGVNAGTARPAKMWQYLLNTEFGARLTVDGEIGPLSVDALNAADAGRFYQRFVAMRRAFYNYRAGSYTPAEAVALAPWHQFFEQHLNLHTDARMQKYLASWLGRTHEAFVA